MYRELIERYMKENEYVSPQPPAAPEMIGEAERAVGVAFPSELRTLLGELNGDRWLLLSTGQIAEENPLVREGLGEVYKDVANLLFFAGNGCGDYYCYKLRDDGTADDSAIYIWEHETDELTRVAADMTELITRYYSDEI